MEKAKEDFELEKGFFMKLAVVQNTLQSLSEDGRDTSSVIGKARHETGEVLRHVSLLKQKTRMADEKPQHQEERTTKKYDKSS
jgi:hypothetical protein